MPTYFTMFWVSFIIILCLTGIIIYYIVRDPCKGLIKPGISANCLWKKGPKEWCDEDMNLYKCYIYNILQSNAWITYIKTYGNNIYTYIDQNMDIFVICLGKYVANNYSLADAIKSFPQSEDLPLWANKKDIDAIISQCVPHLKDS